MLILNPQDLKSCWWITWRPSFECSSYHSWRQSDRHYHHHWVPPNSSKRGRWQAKVWDPETPETLKTQDKTLLLPGHLLECNEIYPSVKHKAWGLLIGFSSLLEYEITQNASLRLIWSHTALCGYPHKKVSIRDLSQIFTTAPILKQFHYFRQHIWVNICVQFHLYIYGTSWLSLKAHQHHPRGACFWYICMTPLDLLRTMAEHQQQVFSSPEQLKRWPCHSLAHWFSKVIVDNV